MLGAHLSRGSVAADLITTKADVVQLFVSNPRGYQHPSQETVSTALAEVRSVSNGGHVVPVYAHLPYLVNPASADPSVRDRSQNLIIATDRVGAGLAGVVVHAGQGGPKATVDEAIQRWMDSLGEVQLTVPLLVENTAGGNAAPGRRAADLIRLVSGLRERGLPAGVCFDTCHAHAAGTEDLIAEFDLLRAELGKVDLVHLNDSRDLRGAARDRHANIGAGTIGRETLTAFAAHSVALNVPTVLETPGDPEVWAKEIAELRAAVN
jgi:deoxyribonuclease-4